MRLALVFFFFGFLANAQAGQDSSYFKAQTFSHIHFLPKNYFKLHLEAPKVAGQPKIVLVPDRLQWRSQPSQERAMYVPNVGLLLPPLAANKQLEAIKNRYRRLGEGGF